MIPRFAAPAAALCLFIAGCNYRPVGSAAHLPDTVHTVAVPSFRNNTQSYHTQAAFTRAVIREFTSRTAYHIVAGDDPDAVATHDAQVQAYDTRYAQGGWMRRRLEWKVASDPFNAATERQVILALGILTAFGFWRVSRGHAN